MKLRTTDYIAALLLFVWIGANWGGGGVLPDILPQPPVESPFPAEGLWLLVASESGELSGAKVIANAESIRKMPDLNSRWLDYGKQGLAEPWATALGWCETTSGGSPYYATRGKRGAREGKLSGNYDAQLKTVLDAVEAVR